MQTVHIDQYLHDDNKDNNHNDDDAMMAMPTIHLINYCGYNHITIRDMTMQSTVLQPNTNVKIPLSKIPWACSGVRMMN